MAAVSLLSGILLWTWLSAAAAAEAEDAYAWMRRMNRAVHGLNYEGRFVYLHDNRLKSLYIAHTAKGDHERERLISLNGPLREVLRDRDLVTCRRDGRETRITQVARRPAVRSFSPLLAVSRQELERYYRVVLGEVARVAGRATRKLHIHPRDDLRYGYRLYLDREYALPLRSVLLDAEQRPLSQILFTEVRVGDDIEIPEEAHGTAGDPAGKGRQAGAGDQQRMNLRPPEWEFTEPPAGFRLDVHRRQMDAESGRPVEHFIFSDGLATISVYVEPAGEKISEGFSHMGTVNALGRLVDGHQVIAMGEVPGKTLAMLLDGMHRRPRK